MMGIVEKVYTFDCEEYSRKVSYFSVKTFDLVFWLIMVTSDFITRHLPMLDFRHGQQCF